MLSSNPSRIHSVPNSCSTILGVMFLPVSCVQKSSGCSRHCLLSSVSPSNIALFQPKIVATPSLSLSAKLTLVKPCSTSMSPTVPLPLPINPQIPIIILVLLLLDAEVFVAIDQFDVCNLLVHGDWLLV